MIQLNILLKPWIHVTQACSISGLTHDSRFIKPGDLFLAYPGEVTDGRLFIQSAIQAGAAAVLYDPTDWAQSIDNASIPCIPFSQLAAAQGLIASRFYDHPTRAFTVVGVTGTNGKTTIAYLLAEAHELLGSHAAYMGTLGYGPIQHLLPSMHTTPDPLSLQAYFNTARHEGIKLISMEVSSHALAQSRVAGVDFTQAIYTNLTHDHLDYHHTMDAYAQAKALLFAVPTLQAAIVNQDDPFADIMIKHLPKTCRLLTYGLQKGCDIYAEDIVMTDTETQFKAYSPWGHFQIQVQLVGQFNVYNALAVLSSLLVSGYEPKRVIDTMKQLKPAPGRMEMVATNPRVFVDYAHTPDALEKALLTLTKLRVGKLIVVFGCGGDRDKTKRPIMGAIASRYADHVMITSDNPRTEDPMQIIREIEAGLVEHASVSVQADRKIAIQEALSYAAPEDILLIAGKGHESYQQIGPEKFPFSDQEIVRACLELSKM